MTAVAAADEALVNRADQLQKLRQQMAAISGKVGGDRSAAGTFRRCCRMRSLCCQVPMRWPDR